MQKNSYFCSFLYFRFLHQAMSKANHRHAKGERKIMESYLEKEQEFKQKEYLFIHCSFD